MSFKISEKSYKVISNWKQLFEAKVPITQEELNSFKTKKLLKWRIELKGTNQIINGLANNSWYKNDNIHFLVFSSYYHWIVNPDCSPF